MSSVVLFESVTRARECEKLYVFHYPLLFRIATRKFQVSDGEAESLIHDVFLSYLSVEHDIRDPRSWLVGAICNASRRYRRGFERLESFDEEQHDQPVGHEPDQPDQVTNRIMVREALARLHEKCRKTLRLRYFEGCSPSELAEQLDTTDGYATKLIYKCLKRAHEIYYTLAETS